MDRRSLLKGLLGGPLLLSATARAACAGSAGAELAAALRSFLAGRNGPALRSFLVAWPLPTDCREVAPTRLPVLRWLPALPALAAAPTRDVVQRVGAAAGRLEWRQTYTQAQVGAAFLDGYGWTELVGLRGAVASEHLACGLLLLGPDLLYPRHRHEAEEIYVPLAGTVEWQQGDGLWRARRPGAIIHHGPNEPHAMRTHDTPLLALYLWRSDNLAQKAHLDPAPASG